MSTCRWCRSSVQLNRAMFMPACSSATSDATLELPAPRVQQIFVLRTQNSSNESERGDDVEVVGEGETREEEEGVLVVGDGTGVAVAAAVVCACVGAGAACWAGGASAASPLAPIIICAVPLNSPCAIIIGDSCANIPVRGLLAAVGAVCVLSVAAAALVGSGAGEEVALRVGPSSPLAIAADTTLPPLASAFILVMVGVAGVTRGEFG